MIDYIEQYGIYIAKVDFEDKPGVYKVRPILIIDEDEMLCVSLKITSQIDAEHSKMFFLENWKKYNLPKPSSVIIDKTYRISKENIYKLLAVLDDEDIERIVNIA